MGLDAGSALADAFVGNIVSQAGSNQARTSTIRDTPERVRQVGPYGTGLVHYCGFSVRSFGSTTTWRIFFRCQV
jgi:hypothetical protein